MATTDELTKETERLNEALTMAEVHLVKLKLGVTGSVDFCDGKFKLSFRRRAAGWGLFVDTSGQVCEPIHDASHEVRIAAAHVLPKLLAELRSLSTQEVHRVKEATRAVEDFLNGRSDCQAASGAAGSHK